MVPRDDYGRNGEIAYEPKGYDFLEEISSTLLKMEDV